MSSEDEKGSAKDETRKKQSTTQQHSSRILKRDKPVSSTTQEREKPQTLPTHTVHSDEATASSSSVVCSVSHGPVPPSAISARDGRVKTVALFSGMRQGRYPACLDSSSDSDTSLPSTQAPSLALATTASSPVKSEKRKGKRIAEAKPVQLAFQPSMDAVGSTPVVVSAELGRGNLVYILASKQWENCQDEDGDTYPPSTQALPPTPSNSCSPIAKSRKRKRKPTAESEPLSTLVEPCIDDCSDSSHIPSSQPLFDSPPAANDRPILKRFCSVQGSGIRILPPLRRTNSAVDKFSHFSSSTLESEGRAHVRTTLLALPPGVVGDKQFAIEETSTIRLVNISNLGEEASGSSKIRVDEIAEADSSRKKCTEDLEKLVRSLKAQDV